MKTAEEIRSLYEARKNRLAPFHAKAAEIRQIILGEMILPLIERDEAQRPAVANLMLQGLEQKAMRISSTIPMIYYPPLSLATEVARERARDRIAVNGKWWTDNRMQLLLSKRARHLTGYAMSPVIIRPGADGYPCWQVRDPLSTFAPETHVGEIHPPDCIFAFPRPLGWLRANYPAKIATLSTGKNPQDDDLYTLLEYADDDWYSLSVVGKESGPQGSSGGASVVELEGVKNKTGMPPCVIPGRINLDRSQSEFEGMVGMFQMQARLMAMEVVGIERSIFPEIWAVSTGQGGTPKIIEQADPHAGITGIIENGQIVPIHLDPSAMNLQAVDRLERGQRLEGGIPAEFGGESASNVRTGRRGDSILSNTIDFSIQAAQRILEESLQVENRIAVNIDKTYFPTRKTIWVGRGSLTYVPTELWETDKSVVKYAHAGVDEQGLVIEAGQRIGIGTLSKEGFMRLDPLIDDPDLEAERISVEAIRQAVTGGLQNLIGSDPNQIEVGVKMIDLILKEHMTIEAAWIKVHTEMQAAQQQAQEGQLPPDQAAAAQPGAAQPGIPQIGAPAPSVQDMHQLLRSLHNQPMPAPAR